MTGKKYIPKIKFLEPGTSSLQIWIENYQHFKILSSLKITKVHSHKIKWW